MPTLSHHRAPLVVLALLFLIPIGTSSLRGLTHILTCADEVGTAISITPPFAPGEEPTLLSSRLIEEGEDPLICEALDVELAIGSYDEPTGEIELLVTVRNVSESDWRGTIQLEVGSTTIPIAVGSIRADDEIVSAPVVRGRDDTLEVQGSLLIGP